MTVRGDRMGKVTNDKISSDSRENAVRKEIP